MTHLKLMTRFFSILMVALLVGCSSDDDASSPEPSLLIGEWRLVSQQVDETLYTFDPSCSGILDINATSYRVTYYSENDGTCEPLPGQSNAYFDYVRNGDTIEFDFAGGTSLFTITTLTETTLVMEEDYMENGVMHHEVESYTK